MRRLCIIAAILLAGLSSAQAGACDEAADQAAMNACADKALKASDAALNATYKKITRRLAGDPDATRQLVAAQRAWVSFRDAECTFTSSGTRGGSAYPMVYSTCLDGLTRSRIADLEALLACQEGDLSCPVPAE
ncbi:MAG: lysozyme inhibitor LprI family protein [Candidatus Kaistia colombiensis]|nr:MAG: lysozyme inhibitor LprI family protein [Kaistia sp.]